MMPMEQPRFLEVVGEALGEYTKKPTADELAAWWGSCRNFNLGDVERALRDHAGDMEDGKRAPRPVDVKRRLGFGARQGAGCAASGANGNCAYPGLFSDSTNGGERWYCPWHRVEHSGPEAERWIEISHRVPYATALEKRVERMTAEAGRARSVVDLSHTIALRHGAKPWQRRPLFALPGQPPAAPQVELVNMDAEAP